MPWMVYFNVEPAAVAVSGTLRHDNGIVVPFRGSQHVEIAFPDAAPQGWGGSLEVLASGYMTQFLRVTLGAGPVGDEAHLTDEQGQPVNLTMRPTQLPIVMASGLDLVAGGRRWVYNGATAFLDLALTLIGQEPAWYPGANIRRFFVTCANLCDQTGVPRLSPATFPNWRDGLEKLARWYQSKGIYGDCCVLADCGQLGLDVYAQQTLVAQTAEVLQGHTNLIFDLGNEPWNNGWDRRYFSRPNLPQLCTRGSYIDGAGDDGYDGPAPWDGYRVHPRRDFPKMLAHCALPTVTYDYKHLVIVDEPFKAGEVDIPNKQYTNPRFFQQAGALLRSINGGTFHSDAGCYSSPLGPVAEACRAAFFGV